MNQQIEKELLEAAKLIDNSAIDQLVVEESILDILEAIGENPQREGLLYTPGRVARSYLELFEGYRVDPIAFINDALFGTECKDPILVKDIEFFSMCEHHMLPILGRAHIEYIPNGKIIGLSKIPRVVDMFARRLQIQESMTQEISNFLDVLLKPKGIAVVIEGLHLCSMIRGVKKQDASMTTSCMRGVYEEDSALRREFLDKISRPSPSLNF
jgi:GTP cyclohydrolase I